MIEVFSRIKRLNRIAKSLGRGHVVIPDTIRAVLENAETDELIAEKLRGFVWGLSGFEEYAATKSLIRDFEKRCRN